MPSAPQRTVNIDSTTRALGNPPSTFSTSDSETLATCFPASPIHSGEIDADSVKQQFQDTVLNGTINDGGHTFGEHNRDYVDAPNYGDVPTGGGGLPSSAWTPNTASPGEGSLNAADQPQGPAPQDPGSEFGSGASATQRQPNENSSVIAGHTLKDYGLGKRAGS